jgi:oxygen-independent coproporphyrinogen III oxidase
LAQVHAAADTLQECGYVRIGLDHFATHGDSLQRAAGAGRLHRNFQGYTADEADALIGIGASAIARLPQGFVQNAPDAGSYADAIDGGQFATVKGLALSPDDRLRAWVIERLMCDLAVDLDDACNGIDFSAELAAAHALSEAGIVGLRGRHIIMTREGQPFVRLVAAAFDAYLPTQENQHSMAV